MPSNADAALKRLSSVSKSLNEASDRFSARLIQVETALNELRIGVGAWIEADRESLWDVDHAVTRVTKLGYDKSQGKWGLFVSTYFEEFDTENELIALRDASRDLRVCVVDKLPDLIDELCNKATELISEVNDKAQVIESIASKLGKTAANDGGGKR